MNRYARFTGSNIEHVLHEGSKITLCGRDATMANRYPVLTESNSTDRRIWRRCGKCDHADSVARLFVGN